MKTAKNMTLSPTSTNCSIKIQQQTLSLLAVDLARTRLVNGFTVSRALKKMKVKNTLEPA